MPFTKEDYMSVTDGMEMPCKCNCGKWFDLEDGYSLDNNEVSCVNCYTKQSRIKELEEEISEYKETISNAEWDITNSTDAIRLREKELQSLKSDLCL